MGLVRTILAVLIALSVAMLPAAGVAAFKPKPATTDMQAMDMSASEPMHECCPGMACPSDKAMDDCGSMAACALKCFSYAGSVSSPLGYSLKLAEVNPATE